MAPTAGSKLLGLGALLCVLIGPLLGQGSLEDYRRAERFLPQNARKLVLNERVTPNWLDKGSRFWYKRDLRDGKLFLLVDPALNAVMPAFDHAKVAAALAAATGEAVSASNLPFDTFGFEKGETRIKFEAAKAVWIFDLKTGNLVKTEKTEERKDEAPSPDGKWTAFLRGYDLWLREAAGGAETQLSRDGIEGYAYGSSSPGLQEQVEAGDKPAPRSIEVLWSPDSKRILTWRIDERGAQRHHLLQFVPPGGQRAKLFSYVYELPGDEILTRGEPVVFEVEAKKLIPVECPPLLMPILMWKAAGSGLWTEDGRRLYFAETVRGYQTARLYEADPSTGKARVVLTETSQTCVDPHMTYLAVVGNGAELVWGSERDGWCQLYLFDGRSGELKNRITSGEFVVREIVRVDEKKRQVYFIAGGREPGRDPYFRFLYRINLDGRGLTLLTPEDDDHNIRPSPDGAFALDTYSKIDTAPVSVLRRFPDGKIVRELEKADLEQLLASGWPKPEPFRVTGRDGKTDIYGVIYRPSNFDPSRRYPVIDGIYNGPQAVRTPKSFQASSHDQALAELGFIVVTIDGMGTAMRSKAFHNVSYKNLGDSGLEDHILGLRQLAQRYPYLDLERVGIYGHSAGGYDSAHALLVHPEFYKVAVSSSGCHDNRADKVWWNELWMGYPVGDHYRAQANPTLAANLKGKLLLVHGDLDDNVHPAATLQLVDALIKANKDFDLLIMPNRHHGLGNGYFVRKRWDYFVKNLLGVEPPKEYPLLDSDSR
jgi:dipeptidyl-peptidase-4